MQAWAAPTSAGGRQHPLSAVAAEQVDGVGQVDRTKGRYAALGDSFSSGDGNNPYLPAPSSAEEKCHRSQAAYPTLVARRQRLHLDFVACSGAVTADFFRPRRMTGDVPNGPAASIGPQIGHLSEDTGLVTLTIGGNDLGFGDMAAACLTAGPTPTQCADRFGTGGGLVAQRLAALRSAPTVTGRGTASVARPTGVSGAGGAPIYSWATIIKAIHERAPRATIAVAGYPQLVDTCALQGGEGRCRVGTAVPGVAAPAGPVTGTPEIPVWVHRDDAAWISATIRGVNEGLQQAVRSSGVRKAVFVPAQARFAGHALCTQDPWLFPFSAAVAGPHGPILPWSGSLHPTADGQKLGYAKAVIAALN